MSIQRRETIHLSLGSTANSISAHLLNLQGLGATSPVCEADITHGVYKDLYVPRCMFVQEGEALEFATEENDAAATNNTANAVVSDYIQASNVLAYSKHSRYRAPRKATTSQYSSSGRHVNWDEEEEEEEEEEESYEDRQRRQQREQNEWQRQYFEPLQEQLESHNFAAKDDSTTPVEEDKENQEAQEATPPETSPTQLDWKEFFAPPYAPNYNCHLPFAAKSILIDDSWDCYIKGSSSLDDWKEDVLFERVRHILEKSDGVQGTTIVTQGHGIYAGLATSLLQHLQDECRTAGRIVMQVTDPPTSSPLPQDSWQPANVRRVRRGVESGLALFDYGQSAHCILPVSVMNSSNLFHRTSQIAMAWETATLAYRATSNRMRIATNAHFEGDSRLSFREFMTCLLPASSQHKLLELDYSTDDNLTLTPGTSVERRQLQQKRQSQQRQVAPGAWMETSLQHLSPNTDDSGARGLHHHWSLVSSLRSASPTEDDLTCLMEGMGVRYRPQSHVGLVMDQTLHQLTLGGYGAGAYWKTDPNQTVVSVLSNSTRSYAYAKNTSSSMQEALSFKLRGYHNRDVTNGILPEEEDCLEAKEYCLGIRDAYEPPEGSGLVEDKEGTYFDDEVY